MHVRCWLLLILHTLGCYGLTCRTEESPKDNELKKVYESCLKRQDGNSSENQRYSDQEWRNQKHRTKDNKMRNRPDRAENRNGNRDRSMDDMSERERMEGRESRSEMYESYDGRRSNTGREERNNNGNRNERDRNTGRNNLSGRDEFLQSEEYGDMQRYNFNTQHHKRNKREKRVEKNSGQRSQYNPNSQKTTEKTDDKNSTSNATRDENKACALHCFLENMQMTGENGMPDRYLVTHAITMNVKNEDLKDFLQESIEECFQILDNENTEDKCEFSKNLLLCLSEKGRANCDDWRGDFQF